MISTGNLKNKNDLSLTLQKNQFFVYLVPHDRNAKLNRNVTIKILSRNSNRNVHQEIT